MNGANTTGSTALLPWIQEVCASERRLEAHLADLKQLEEGSLHIVAFTSTLTQWLPQITKRFTEAHPHIDLRITCCDDQAQLEHIVESGQANVGFVALPVKRPLEMELLVRDPLLVAVAPDSPFATRKRFPKKALASEPYIKLDSGEYSEMDRLFRANGVGRCAGLHQVHERLDPRSLRKRCRGAAALGASKNEAGAIPTSFRLRRALLHDPHLEGAHENHGHALAGDGIAGPEVLARRLVVALDEALRRRPGEGAARPA